MIMAEHALHFHTEVRYDTEEKRSWLVIYGCCDRDCREDEGDDG